MDWNHLGKLMQSFTMFFLYRRTQSLRHHCTAPQKYTCSTKSEVEQSSISTILCEENALFP
jgi:hypothetical protein